MNEKSKILLVEDDKNLSTLLKEFLEVKGYEVLLAFNGEEGLLYFQENEFDLCILDVMMPKMDGFTLAGKLQDVNPNIPFLFLTAKQMLEDKIKGLKLGADDYVTKPFSMEELLLRIKNILKRAGSLEFEKLQSKFTIGTFIFDFDKRTLKHDESTQKLTSKEAELLNLLCMNRYNVLERSVALNKIWQNDNYFTARSMDVYITKLRGYFKQDPSIEIVNVHGMGFKLVVH